MNSCSIIIRGRVQGVFFRYYTKKNADRLILKGTVQNLADGSVKIVASGNKSNLDLFVEWCNQGSPASKVEEVLIDWNVDNLTFNDFTIIR